MENVMKSEPGSDGMKALLFVLACGVVFCTLYIARPLFHGEEENARLASQSANAYIEADFAGWQEITVAGFGTFRIPGDWCFAKTDGGYAVYAAASGADAPVGVGAVLNGQVQEWIDFRDSVFGFAVQEVSAVNFVSGLDRNTTLQYNTAKGESESINFWELALGRDTDYTSLTFLFPEKGTKDCGLEEILKAVLYSFTAEQTETE